MIRVGIANAAWDPARNATLDRLERSLGEYETISSQVREHARTWATRLWRWAEKQDDGVILLNDDVTVCPNLVEVVTAMSKAVPDTIFALHTTAPVAESLAMCGERWVRSYHLTGPGYFLPKGVAARLLDFTDRAIVWTQNEDAAIMHFAWHEQRPIWHSIPALVQHDVSVPSTLGYDHHPLRQTRVAWTDCGRYGDPAMLPVLTEPRNWEPRKDPILVECPWMTRDQLARVERALEQGTAPCCFCAQREGVFGSETGAHICGQCVMQVVGAAIKPLVKR